VASRVIAAAMSILAAGLFAAGADPLGVAVVTVATVTFLLVIARPTPSVYRAWGGHFVSLGQLVLPRVSRVSQQAGGEDCPLVLTVSRR
jgi:hypothetical protein